MAAFVDQLALAGVRHVCACPGSRSTPLAIEIAEHPLLTLWMHLDERSAAYFGLGLARAAREPVALLATSGTAAANFFPAIVEANLARVALVVLTADRPHELRDNGAPQTIDQLRLYGGHVKWFFDLPEPDATDVQPRLVCAHAARAVATAVAEPAGPVHLNWPFREPLVPARNGQVCTGSPTIRVYGPWLAPSEPLDVPEPHGVFVVGPQDDPELPNAVVHAAERLGYPILADALSGVRCGPHDRSHVIDTYDAFLRDAATAGRLEPHVVLRIGAIPTSKPLQQYMQKHARARHSLVDPGGWRDPFGLATDVLHVDARLLLDGLARRDTDGWLAEWTRVNAITRRALDAHMHRVDEVFEGKVFAELSSLLPEGAVLFAGNSMPVRDLDTFLPQSGRALRCLSNRGANGIDGVVSSALGASAAGQGPVVLATGDVGFYHDLNGLLAARKHVLDLLVVLLNNNGGGIFSFLPQAELPDEQFELLFGTPHGLDFQPLVEAYGGRFVRVRDWPSFGSAVCAGLARGGLQVVEVPTQRPRNVSLHRAVWRSVAEALAPVRVC